MQLFALDEKENLIPAAQALKHLDYKCLECSKEVRRRGGIHRQDHFYHIKPDPACRQSQKSAAHLHLQLYIARHLPDGEWTLERRFPTIGRIADLAWEQKHIIFEIQCSPISAQEVRERNENYKSLGYEVIWILHEKQFNRYKVSAAELFLSDKTHYFSAMDSYGRGIIFDQLQHIEKGIRKLKIRGEKIDPGQPYNDKGKLYFSGDFVDRKKKGDQNVEKALSQVDALKKKLMPTISFSIKRKYINFFHMILEKFCHG